MLTKSDLSDPARNVGDDVRVADAMTRGVWAVHPDTPVLEAVEMMLDKGIHRVFVLDGPAQLIGIMTTTDVMRALVAGHFVEDPAAAKRRGRPGESSGEPAAELAEELATSADRAVSPETA